MTRKAIADAGGSPAHAGIDPLCPMTICWSTRFPRTRGDRPHIPLSVYVIIPVPPHTRG